jgi:hypothetical protein
MGIGRARDPVPCAGAGGRLSGAGDGWIVGCPFEPTGSESLKSPHIVGLFCPYSRPLLWDVLSNQQVASLVLKGAVGTGRRKETYYSVKRDLLQCQKRPYSVKRRSSNAGRRKEAYDDDAFYLFLQKKKTGSEPGLEGAVGAGSRKEAYV